MSAVKLRSVYKELFTVEPGEVLVSSPDSHYDHDLEIITQNQIYLKRS